VGVLSGTFVLRVGLGATLLGWGALAFAAGTSENSTRLLSARALLPAWLAPIEADIVISADSLEWRGLQTQQVELPVTVHDGVVTIRAAHARLASGEVKLDARRDTSGAATLHLRATRVTLGELPALRPFVSGVPVDVDVALRGQGDNLQALAASASGRLQVRNTGPGIVRHGFEEMGDNLVYHFISAFEVFRRAGSDAHLECMALDLPFSQGVALASKSMELRTRRLHVRGGGSVNLRDETIDLVFKPETRRVLKLQSLKVVERVRVRGTLRAPQVTLDSAHLVGRAARLGLDVANLGGGAVFNRLWRGKPTPGLCAGREAAPFKTP
jgi:uncharacterized protein involved in outer membrane biogenesis